MPKKVTLLLLVAGLVSGCSFFSVDIREDRGNLPPTEALEKPTDKTDGVEDETNNYISLPGNFPPELPIYPDAQFETASSTGSDSGFVMFSSSSTLQQITKYYEENLEKLGWAVEARSNDENGTSFSISKINLASTVGIRKSSDKTYLSLTFGPP